MSNDHDEEVWVFRFCLESELEEVKISPEVAENLLEQISVWAEERGLQIGGGYRKPTAEEMKPGPIFELRDESSAGNEDRRPD